jgi:predicted secreted Zn-dependent protease
MVSAMPGRATRGRAALALIALVGVGLRIVPAGAEVGSSTEVRAYNVSGTSAASLISFMRNHPFHGDRGAAVANIRPYYSLSVFTKDPGKDGVCHADKVDVSIRFVMTLPKATNAGAMSAGTRSAWTGFTAFARQHEETHRGIYVDCANAFVAKVLQMTSMQSCGGLEASIRRELESAKRACELKQNAFDRRDYRRVFGLSLFQMAKYAKGK